MGHKKLIRFAALKEFQNVFEKDNSLKGKWNTYFGNDNPIVLELACGKGEYTQNRAAAEPNKNFIGIDIKGNRMFIGARNCLDQGLTNAAYLRISIDHITEYFSEDEVSEIWIIFPDPFLNRAKNRLTHHRFLKLYHEILQPQAIINLKTDSKPLFDFTKEVVEFQGLTVTELNDNIYEKGTPKYPLNILTAYERRHLLDKRTIQHIAFQLKETPIVIPPKNSEEDESENN
jgi:tRNA (guanine-N7-)-methyltransferase